MIPVVAESRAEKCHNVSCGAQLSDQISHCRNGVCTVQLAALYLYSLRLKRHGACVHVQMNNIVEVMS